MVRWHPNDAKQDRKLQVFVEDREILVAKILGGWGECPTNRVSISLKMLESTIFSASDFMRCLKEKKSLTPVAVGMAIADRPRTDVCHGLAFSLPRRCGRIAKNVWKRAWTITSPNQSV
jgi:hypothetical protein